MVTIRAEGLAVTLGRRRVLHGIDVTVQAGSLVGVIGPNGAGKSTLARAMLALAPAADGRVTVDDVDVARLTRRDLARRIAYLPQGQTVHWPLTVERLVALGRLPHLAPFSRLSAVDAAAVERAMAAADVLPLRARTATELSGGERARALLARALAVDAPGLIVDEPLAALDPGHQLDVMALLRARARAGGLVVAVLHDLTVAARFCDRLLLLAEGLLMADGPPSAVLTAEHLATVYGVAAYQTRVAGEPLVVPLTRVRGTAPARPR